MTVNERTAAATRRASQHQTIRARAAHRQSDTDLAHLRVWLIFFCKRLHLKHTIIYWFSWRRFHSYTRATATGRALKNEYEVTAYVSAHEHNDCIQLITLLPACADVKHTVTSSIASVWIF